MDRLAKLVSVCAVGLAWVAFAPAGHATYIDLQPPVGWNYGAGAGATYSFPVKPGDVNVVGGGIRTTVPVPVGGRSVPVNVKLPLREGVKRVAALAIFANPALRTAAAVATWLGAANIIYDVAKGWMQPDPAAERSDGQEYSADQKTWHGSRESACQHRVASYKPYGDYVSFSGGMVNGLCTVYGYRADNSRSQVLSTGVQSRSSSCPAGYYISGGVCSPTLPMTSVDKDGFVRILEPDPRVDTDGLPNIVWPASWPVRLPEVQPTFIPTGNPVPNPNYDPNKPQSTTNSPYSQPGVNVQPAPTNDRPWQIDLQPVNRPTTNPNPGSDPVPNTNPDGTPKPDAGDKPSNEKLDLDLCERHPDIAACQKLDEPEEQPLDTKEKTISITPDSGWGAEDASCPAPRYIYPQGRQIAIPFDLFCTYAHGLRPVVIAMAWLSAAFILVGARESS